MISSTSIAIISAGSVLCGVIISQIFSLIIVFLNRKHHKNILLREKYEEMMFYFTDSLNWIQQLNNCITKGEIFSLAQSKDSRKALSLCLLYFPDLVDFVDKYMIAQSNYYNMVVGIFNESIPANAGGQAIFNNANYEKVFNELIESRINFENSIINCSKKYLKA